MERKLTLVVAKAAVALGTFPLLIWAFSSGPNPGHAGVPGEPGTCVVCHIGTLNNPANGGSVAVTFPTGATYTPGVKQHLRVTISDPAQQAWGFQLTARSSSNPASMAGSFQSTDGNTRLMCAAADLGSQQPVGFSAGQSQTCPSGMPLQYMEHSLTGYQGSRGTTGSHTYEFDWMPPASDAGDITIYVAGNAANGNGNNTGDHIYSTTYSLTVAPAGGGTGGGGATPSVGSNGIVNAAGGQPVVTPGAYISIYGSNLAAVTDNWNNSIVNGKLPTELNGVSVTVGGKPAYVYFISEGQINAIAPDVPPGPVQVQVTTPAGKSPVATVEAQPYGPACFLWNGKYAVATHTDFSPAVKPGTFPGPDTVPAKPGEIVILWGTGFGPTNPAVEIGVMPPGNAPAVVTPDGSPVTVNIGGANAEVIYAVLSGYAGLYQIAVRVPESTGDGDVPVKASIGSHQSPENAFLTVQR